MKVNERELRKGIEVDIGATHATPEGYGRLTIRKPEGADHFDIYDLDHETVVDENDDLEQLIEKANQLSPLHFEYEPDG